MDYNINITVCFSRAAPNSPGASARQLVHRRMYFVGWTMESSSELGTYLGIHRTFGAQICPIECGHFCLL